MVDHLHHGAGGVGAVEAAGAVAWVRGAVLMATPWATRNRARHQLGPGWAK